MKAQDIAALDSALKVKIVHQCMLLPSNETSKLLKGIKGFCTSN